MKKIGKPSGNTSRTTLSKLDRELVLGVFTDGPRVGQDAIMKLTPDDFKTRFPLGSIGHRLQHASSTPAAIPTLLAWLKSMAIVPEDVNEVLDDFRHHRAAFTRNGLHRSPR